MSIYHPLRCLALMAFKKNMEYDQLQEGEVILVNFE